jgi:hypothetical protein
MISFGHKKGRSMAAHKKSPVRGFIGGSGHVSFAVTAEGIPCALVYINVKTVFTEILPDATEKLAEHAVFRRGCFDF